MKKLFLLTIVSLMSIACSNDDKNEELISEEGNLLTTNSATPSIGELHNQGLDEMYLYLTGIPDLDADNIHNYSKSFLESNYDEEASNYYSLVVDGFDFNSQLSEEFNNEIDYLYFQLDEGIIDFDNFNDFNSYMNNYKTKFIQEENDLIAWEVYVDIFVHSLDYWSTNLDKWENLLGQDNNQILTNKKDCTQRTWVGRAWCNTKKYIGADVGAGASNVIIALASQIAVVFGPVAGASLGASAAAVIIDLITGKL